MSYDDDGFTKRTIGEIIQDFEEEIGNLFDTVDITPSSIIWQQLKASALESFHFETLLETAAEQMSIQTAVGVFLDRHGELLGMPRRGATKAQGYVDVTYTDPPFTVPAGTKFTSSRNEYLSDDAVEIPEELTLTKTRTGESYDYFPSTTPYAETVDRILDENNNPIASGFWTFDQTYHNNIYWISSSSGFLIEDENYTVEISGDVTQKIEVASVDSGVTSNAKPGEITTCVDYPSLSVTNDDGVSGAIDRESDANYRERLLQAQNRNFTLAKVRDLALGINGVRAAQVYQNKGTDQTSVSDWDNPVLGANITLDQYAPEWSQNFVPGNQVLSLGQIVLKGRAVNSPPAIRCGVKQNIDVTGLTDYFDINTFEKADLDPTITGFQDIKIDLKYNGLDKTKTYRFDLWLKQAEDGVTGIDFTTNYWLLRTSAEAYGGDSSRYALLQHNGSTWVEQGTGLDLMFKTRFNGAAYTVLLAPEDGFGFENLSDELEDMLDYVDGGGLSPIGIQYIISEPDEILIDIKGTIYITELADFRDVREDIITNIETYLEALDSGDNVIYSRIEYEIMKHPQVWKQRELYIKRSDTSDWIQEDIPILEDEIADLGTRSFARGL